MDDGKMQAGKLAEKPGGLTLRQQKFCAHYAAHGNASAAAREAGYSEKTAYVIGHENLRKPKIQDYLARNGDTGLKASIATAQERQEWLTKVMRGEEEGADMKDRIKAAEVLARCQADIFERAEISGKKGTRVEMKWIVVEQIDD